MKTLLLAVLSTAALHGCRFWYSDRFTDNFEEFPEIGGEDLPDGIVEEAGRDEQSMADVRAALEKIDQDLDTEYRMNAGDKMAIKIYGHDDIGGTTTISPDGTVGIAFAGQVKLGGLTMAEGSEKIRKALEPYIRDPVVSISVFEIASATATIGGACKNPGAYGITSDSRLADIYAIAGSSDTRLFNGVVMDVADLERSIIVRDGNTLPVDFSLAIEHGDPLHNVRLRKGDYIYIAQRMESSVTICGEVTNPHKRLFEPNMGLIETLTAAGWMLDSHWKHVIIIRDGIANPKLYKVDVDGILAGKRKNVKLMAGDIVYVPKDDLSEYNVFVRKLLPTAEIVNLLFSRNTLIRDKR